MAIENIAAFTELVRNHAELRAKVEFLTGTASSPQAAAERVMKLAGALGLPFTAEELIASAKQDAEPVVQLGEIKSR